MEHDIVRAEHNQLKSVQGLGVKAAFGAKRQTSSKCKAFAIQTCNGGRTHTSPLSPLKKKAKNRITKKDDNKTESKATRIQKRCFANAQHDKIPCVIASVSEAINRQRIPMILALHTVDCHEAQASRNDTKEHQRCN